MTEQVRGEADFKTCCANAYSADWLTLVLGESYHPGGLDLTRRLAAHLQLPAGARVLDVASGRGASALAIGADIEVSVCGVDLSPVNVEAARAAALAAGMDHRVEFRRGDAEALPVGAGEFDAVLCECALCTFPDKPTAVAQMARAVRPGGRVGITDVTADVEHLPAQLRTLAAQVACIGAASTPGGYRDLLTCAGLVVETVENHDDALIAMVERIQARLFVVRMITKSQAMPGLDAAAIAATLSEVKEAIAAGLLGYTLIVARKPGAGTT